MRLETKRETVINDEIKANMSRNKSENDRFVENKGVIYHQTGRRPGEARITLEWPEIEQPSILAHHSVEQALSYILLLRLGNRLLLRETGDLGLGTRATQVQHQCNVLLIIDNTILAQ